MTDAVPASVIAAYDEGERIANEHLPYVYGGGHSVLGQPSGGGFDCSGLVSAILAKAKLLGKSYALNTSALMDWGIKGEGEFMTVWVRNDSVDQHTFIEFKLPGKNGKKVSARPIISWEQAAHTGTIVGWFNDIPTTGFTPRRKA